MAEERSTVEILEAARERITPAEDWCTNNYALDAEGFGVSANSDGACRWCAIGSVLAECEVDESLDVRSNDSVLPAYNFLITAAEKAGVGTDVPRINDERGHEATLALLDSAIQLAEQEAMA